MNKDIYCIIYNPISGSGSSQRILKKIIQDFNLISYKYQIFKSEYKGHIQEFCKDCNNYIY